MAGALFVFEVKGGIWTTGLCLTKRNQLPPCPVLFVYLYPLVLSLDNLRRSISSMNSESGTASNPTPSDPQLNVCQHNIFSQNISGSFDSDLHSDLALIVGVKRFNVHKIILATQGEYFRALLSNGMSETNKHEISIKEQKVALFEKLLQYVYSGEVKLNNTKDAAEMMIMANKYLLTELQNSIGTHLETILSIRNFCSIYSAAFTCSSPDLMAKCLSMADSKPMEILKLDGLLNLDVNAMSDLVRRESFKPAQAELFVAIKKWIAADKDEVADLLYPLSTSLQFRVIIQHTIENKIHVQRIVLLNQPPFDSIARVKRQVRSQYGATVYSSISLYYEGTHLQDDMNLECYGIPDGGQLYALCQ